MSQSLCYLVHITDNAILYSILSQPVCSV